MGMDNGMDVFTPAELELLCSSGYQGNTKEAAVARLQKKQIAARLASRFTTGSADTPQDLRKARRYAAMAMANDAIAPSTRALLSTETFYDLHLKLITQPRLLWGRINRFLSTLSTFRRATSLPFINIFALSYVFSFAFDVLVVLKTTFKDPTPESENYWQRAYIRFKNVLTKDRRPYRMLNDLVWATVNLVTFFLSGPLFLLVSPIINLVGFSFDSLHELYWLYRKQKDHSILIDKLNNKAGYEAMRAHIIEERQAIVSKHVRIAVCTFLVLVGMILFFFPPAFIPYAAAIGSALSLVAGSVFTGFGRTLYEALWPKRASNTAILPTTETAAVATLTTPPPASVTPTATPETPEIPAIAPTASITPAVVVVSKTPSTTPPIPETPMAPETPAAPETPMAPETPATPETPAEPNPQEDEDDDDDDTCINKPAAAIYGPHPRRIDTIPLAQLLEHKFAVAISNVTQGLFFRSNPSTPASGSTPIPPMLASRPRSPSMPNLRFPNPNPIST